MERYDLLYRLYEEFDTETLREYQFFVDLFPPVDSRVALEHWEEASDELDQRKTAIREAFPAGTTFAEIAAYANREIAFTSLDLLNRYGRAVNALVLDVDETLRSAGGTDNEIPRETLYLLTEFHERGVPIVICTGQTLENVKGFMIQGLGNELVHSGTLSIVYEAGNGVFTPGHGSRTKQLLYEDLGDEIRSVFESVRTRVLSEAPEAVRRGCHLQGNEFNVTLKPNFETGSSDAETVIDRGLVHLLDLLGAAVVDVRSERDGADDVDPEIGGQWARTHYGHLDPEISEVLEAAGEMSDRDVEAIPDHVRELFELIDVGYYHADAAEISSLELNKVEGITAALDVLGIDDPFVLVMGDSKSDLRMMRWAEANGTGLSAAPEHASRDVLSHVMDTDGLTFKAGQSAEMLRTIYVLNLLARLE
ncbi:HAD family hydrolase [Halopenitus sp. H-Gu1]|uniref:HAD family hydrolase n=1 Tax=Halopenitus sp. H-Gu1 TaxID=3242697 RepID=UPI00359D1C32